MKKNFVIASVVVGAIMLLAAILFHNQNNHLETDITNGEIDKMQDDDATEGVPLNNKSDTQSLFSSESNGKVRVETETKIMRDTATNSPPVDAQQSGRSDFNRDRFVRIAFEEASKVMAISDPGSATIKYENSTAVVTFPFPHKDESGRPQAPGPDYLARVKIDKQTGKIVEILGAQ